MYYSSILTLPSLQIMLCAEDIDDIVYSPIVWYSMNDTTQFPPSCIVISHLIIPNALLKEASIVFNLEDSGFLPVGRYNNDEDKHTIIEHVDSVDSFYSLEDYCGIGGLFVLPQIHVHEASHIHEH